MSYISNWRLFSSAETPEAAQASGPSLVAGLLMGAVDELAVSRYFKGGFKVEFRLAHEGAWEEVESSVLSAFGRVCGEWTRTGTEPEHLALWCGDLVIPSIESVDMEMGPAEP